MQIFENISQIITKIGPTQILSILLLKFGPHKYFSYYYQNWTTKLYHLYESPYPFILSTKPKRHNQSITKLVATQHPLQSLLLHNTYYKAQEKYLAIFVKAQVCTWQYFTKSENIIKSPNTTFGNILSKTQILFWQHFTKNSLLLWQHFIKNQTLLIFGQTIIPWKPKYYLTKIFKSSIVKLL